MNRVVSQRVRKLYFVLMMSVFLLFLYLQAGCKKTSPYTPVTFSDNEFVVNTELLIEKKPVFYKFAVKEREISFFIVKVNGEVLSFFNLCRACKGSGVAGYRGESEHIACKTCKIIIPYEGLHSGVGNCIPFTLEGRASDGTYVIKKESILKGIRHF